ncbi:MAG: hypothetical protein AAF228_10375 [Pseudomonadota bacterium]
MDNTHRGINRRKMLQGLGLTAAATGTMLASPYAALANSLTQTKIFDKNLPVGATLEGFTDYRTGKVYQNDPTANTISIGYTTFTEDIYKDQAYNCSNDIGALHDMATQIYALSSMPVQPFIIFAPTTSNELADSIKNNFQLDNFLLLTGPRDAVVKYAEINLGAVLLIQNGKPKFHTRAYFLRLGHSNLAKYQFQGPVPTELTNHAVQRIKSG